MKLSVPEYILSIKPYVAGKPLEELEREYGIADAIKLASNENPLGPSPLAIEAIHAAVENLNRYPDGGGYEMTRCLAQKFNIAPDSIVLGNGSDDIIALLACTLLKPGDELVLPQPSFLFYEISLRSAGALPIWVPLKSNAIDLEGIQKVITSKTRLVFLNVPFNPTGAIISRAEFENFMGAMPPHVVVVVDEAYIEFVRDPDCVSSLDCIKSDNRIVGMRTFSKAYGLAGLRVGYGIMSAELSELLNRVRQPFNVNSLAQVAAMAALKDDDFLQKTIRLVHTELDFLYASLARLGLEYLPSQANFLMINVGQPADVVFERLLKQGVIVRSMASYSYPEHIRVNVGLHSENVRFIEALEAVL
ncbi:MAG: histidinol-phosphate transaminase [Deltaproteobacteria bacterium]|jgi:histidinol-phosphate aminotransferase|nr:histidinol-phosphate transaminase [Deltaproteobacteria bacterium]